MDINYIVEYLLKHNVKNVRILDNLSTGFINNINPLLNEYDNLSYMYGDISNIDTCRKAMKNMDVVCHQAALGSVPRSIDDPLSSHISNVNGFLNILISAKENGIKRIVYASSSSVYGDHKSLPKVEEKIGTVLSPYAATKIAADQLALSYWKSFETPVSILRPFNTYGPRQSARAVIPTIVSQIVGGKREIHLGALSPTRDFNFVEDTCRAFLAVSNCEAALGKSINSASNFEVSIGDTAALIAESMNASIEIITDEERLRPERSEVNRLFGDNSLLRQLTDWAPEFSGLDGFKRGLQITSEWFVNPKNLAHYRPDIYSV